MACAWLGWMSHRNRQVKLEQAVIDRIESYTSNLSYQYAHRPSEYYDRKNRRPGPQWLTRMFDEYPFVDLVDLTIEVGGERVEHLDDVGELTQLKELEIGFGGEIPTLEPLRDLTKLENLDIQCAYLIKSLKPLENCVRLTRLSLSDAKELHDIEVVRQFSNLESITLHNTAATDLAPLGTLKELTHVNVKGVVRSIAGLENATEIEKLSIQSPMLQDFQPLSGLKKVRRLTLGCDDLDSLKVISQMKDLEFCQIESKKLRTLAGIEGLSKLKELRLHNCESLENVQAIQGLNLEELAICNYPPVQKFPPILPLKDLSGIEDLALLEKLNLSNNSIEDFVGLKNLPLLKELTAKHCTELRSLKGVTGLLDLRRLELDQCFSLPSLTGLAGLNQLDILDCYKCTSLTDISELQHLPMIRRVNFYQSANVVGGPFLLKMKPTAFVKLPETTDRKSSAVFPLDPFLNFEGTKTSGELIDQLRGKYPDFPVEGPR